MTVVQRTKRVKAPALRQGFSFARIFPALVRVLAIACVSVLLFSCATTGELSADRANATPSSFIPAQFDWTPVCDGASYAYYQNDALPLRYHCVRIDLSAQNLTIRSYPNAPGRFRGKTTRAFSRETGAQIAINATPFSGRFFTKRTVGVHIADGTLLSPPQARYDALAFFRDQNGYTARLITPQAEETLRGAEHAFGGFWAILRDGTVQEFSHTSYDARTAVGISKEGKTLFLLCVEGGSGGLSYPECAEILRFLGAWDALQLDGGSSSDLVLNGKSVFSHTLRRRVGVSIGLVNTSQNH